MKVEDIYDNLFSVKVVRKPRIATYSFFSGSQMEPESNKWAAVYHKIFQKYIVTNDIDMNGLNGSAQDLLIIGFADSLDYIMFLVYEHQVSMGFHKTIQDEINDRFKKEKIVPKNSEWDWAKTLIGTPFFNEDGKVLGTWKWSNSDKT